MTKDNNKSTQTSIVDLLSLARAQIGNHEFESAHELVERALEIDPTHPEARKLRSELRSKASLPNSLLSISNDVSDAPLKAVEAGKLSSAFEILHDMYPEWNRDIPTLLRNPLQEPADEQPSVFLLHSIEECLSSGLVEEALEMIGAALLEFPANQQLARIKHRAELDFERKSRIDTLIAQARSSCSRRAYEEAIKAVESARRLDPENLEIKQELINALLMRVGEVGIEDWRIAEEHLQRVLMLDAEHRDASGLYRLVLKNKKRDIIDRCLTKSGELVRSDQLEPAEQILLEGLRQYPDDSRLSGKLVEVRKLKELRMEKDLVLRTEAQAQQFVREKNFPAAETMVRATLKRVPESLELLQLLETIEASRAQFAMDEAVNRALEQIRPLREAGDLPSLRAAIAIADDVLALHPDDRRLLPLRAQLEKALAEAEQSVTILEARAKEAAFRGDFKLALDAIRQAILLDSEATKLRALEQEFIRRHWVSLWVKYRKTIAIGAGAFVLVVTALIVFLRWNRGPLISDVRVLSEPSGAIVYIDNEEKGRTPLETPLNLLSDGPHQFRLHLEGYNDYQGSHNVRLGQKNSIGPIPLIPTEMSPEEALYQRAVRARNEGRLLPPEPDNVLDLVNVLLSMDTSEARKFKSQALTLKEEVKSALLAELSSLRPFELKTEKELDLLDQIILVDPGDEDIRKRLDSFPGIIERLKTQIEKAIDSRRLLTTESGSALNLLKRLNRMSPTRERKYILNKMKEVETKVVELAREKCKTQGESCIDFVQLALVDFPNNTELLQLGKKPSGPGDHPPPPPPDDRLRRMEELKSRAEKAFEAGKYVTPDNDNAYYYSSEALKLDYDHRADLKEIRDRAEDLMNAGPEEGVKQVFALCSKDHLARALLTPQDTEQTAASLKQAKSISLAILRLESKTKIVEVEGQLKEIEGRLKDIEALLSEFRYSVVHNHNPITNCKGVLVINGYGIQYRTDEVKDSFNKSYAELREVKSKNNQFDLIFLDKKRDFKSAIEQKVGGTKQVEEIVERIRFFEKLRSGFAATN